MCVAEEQQHVASSINLRPQNDASIERLLAGFRWQRIGFVDALRIPQAFCLGDSFYPYSFCVCYRKKKGQITARMIASTIQPRPLSSKERRKR